MREMVRCCDLLDLTVHRNYEQGDKMVVGPLAKMVEHFWEGIGEWKA